MKRIYKLKFDTGVHFGNGNLNDSSYIVKSDTIFSSLCIEAIKLGLLDELVKIVNEDRLFISDAMPFVGKKFLIPKPMKIVESRNTNTNSSIEKKKMKKMSYIPADNIKDYLYGNFNQIDNLIENLGEFTLFTKVSIRTSEALQKENANTEPYHVGSFKFNKGNGIYIIVAYKEKEDINILDTLMHSLGISGIGGKRNVGFGKFRLEIVDKTDFLESVKICGEEKEDRGYMLISTSIPEDEKLESVIEDCNYLLEKRSGFVFSETFSSEQLRKIDTYLIKSGSYFTKMYRGKLLDVSPSGGNHAVYRYAKAMFMEV